MTGAPTPPKAATSQGPSSSTSCWMSTSRCEPSTVPSPTFSSSLSSPGPRAYLDHAGGAPVLAEVRAALAHLPEANAQSPHAEGRAARDALDAARDRAATAVGAPPGQVVFCSGGTEAVNLALLGAGHGGLLLARREVPLQPLQFGGPQEWGRRAGREDVAAAVAVATALDVCARCRADWSLAARPRAERLRAALVELGARPTGAEPRLPNFAAAAFGRVEGEDLLLALDLAGIAASSGSACASGSLDPSHVLLAMGLSMAEALGSLRLTGGPQTNDAEIDRALQALSGIAALA